MMPLEIKPGGGWHRLLARVVQGEPATLGELVAEVRDATPGTARRAANSKVRAAAVGLEALGLTQLHGKRLTPTPRAAAELARLDALAKEDA